MRFLQRSPSLDWVVGVSTTRPIGTVLAWILLIAVSTLGVARLQFETTGSSLLNRSGPDWKRYQWSLATFGGDEVIVVAIEGDTPFSPGVLERVSRLTRVMERQAGVRRVDSLYTVPFVRSFRDGSLSLKPALARQGAGAILSDDQTMDVVGSDRIAPETLVSTDGRVLAVNVLLEGDVGEQRDRIVRAAYDAVAGSRAWVSGVPVYETRVSNRTRSDVLVLGAVTIVLIAVLLAAVFRALVAVVVPLAASGAGAWCMLGLMGAMNEPVTITGMILPSVILALGCAYTMHVLTAVRRRTEHDSVALAIRQVAVPIALSGLTTAVGFGAMATVEIDAIRSMGGYGAVGVLAVLAACLTLVPALLTSYPLAVVGDDSDRWIRQSLAPRLLAMIAKHRLVIISGWAVLLLSTTVGLARLHVETDAVLWWPRGAEIRESYESVRARLSGISPMNIVLQSSSEEGFDDPRLLKRLDEFAAYLSEIPDVGKVISLADPLRQLHGGFEGRGDHPLPVRGDLISQYLLLLDSVSYMRDLVTADYDTTNILLRVNNNGSRRLLEIANEAKRWWAESGVEGVSAEATGIMFEFARAEEEIAWGQIRGLAVALAAIGGVLVVLLRSLPLALVALIPNLVPLAVVFGIMGVAGIALDAGTICMGTLALGIAVDDTIHTITVYRQATLDGHEKLRAIALSFDQVLPPILYTTAAIGIGFAVLVLSEFALTRNLGIVTTTVVALCLAADGTLLPALIVGRAKQA